MASEYVIYGKALGKITNRLPLGFVEGLGRTKAVVIKLRFKCPDATFDASACHPIFGDGIKHFRKKAYHPYPHFTLFVAYHELKTWFPVNTNLFIYAIYRNNNLFKKIRD